MNGHNVYGGPTDFRATCTDLVEFLEQLLDIEPGRGLGGFGLPLFDEKRRVVGAQPLGFRLICIAPRPFLGLPWR